jgi:hypothetical protein
MEGKTMKKTMSMITTRVLSRVLAFAMVVAGFGIVAQSADARGKIPVILQITNNSTGTIEWPKVRSQDGDRISFVSTGDVMGPATETVPRQIYVYDYDGFEANLGTMTQVTSDPVHSSYDAARSTDDVFASGRPDVIAFISTADLDPADGVPIGDGNADGNPEVFLYHLTDDQGPIGTFTQITFSVAPVVNANVYSSDSGKTFVFDSNGDYDGGILSVLPNAPGGNPGGITENNPGTQFSNPDGSREIFKYTVVTTDSYPYDGNFTQVSDGPGGTSSTRPVIGGYWFPRQSQSTVYMSDYDQTGEGLRTGQHIYLFHRPSATNGAMVAPETPNGQPNNGIYENPALSAASPFARGPFTVFTTDADLWNNGMLGIHQLYRYRIFHPRQTQYTAVSTGRILNPVVSDGGGLIVFQATGDVFNPAKVKDPHTYPTNADLNSEIFFQKGRRKITQMTNTTVCVNDMPSVRDDGTMIAFRSTCDLVPGSNPGGVEQVFFYTQVKSKSTLACTKPSVPCDCQIASGCINEANGLDLIRGRSLKPPKKNCLDKGNC